MMHPRRTSHRLITAAASAALLLGGCATLLLGGCAATLPALPEYHPHSYQLGSGDEIRVITYDEDQLTGDFQLNDQGNVAMPMLGTVHAAGKSPEQLAQDIAAELTARHLMVKPSVSVEVRVYRPVFVLGEVNKPGQYPYQPGMTMLSAVAVAGGFTYRAVRGHATVVRNDGDHADKGSVSPESLIVPGDVINVDERYF